MGLWSRQSSSALTRAETVLLSLSSTREPLSVRNVPLQDGNFIHCVSCGSSEYPPLVMLPGFCGGGAGFYRVIGTLAQAWRLYLVDLLGMGQSSRPPFTANTTEAAERFFVDSLAEALRTLGLSRFALLGHSFGAYIAACYAELYQSQVTHLLLVSPLGVTRKPEGYSFEQSLRSMGWKEKTVWKAVKALWSRRISPSDVLRKVGPVSGQLVRLYTRRRLQCVPREELAVLECYLEQVCLLPGSGEYSLPLILELGSYARRPLSPRLSRLSVPMSFFYGEEDWISPRGAVEVKAAAKAPVAVVVVPEAGHQLFLEQPEALSAELQCVLQNPAQSADFCAWDVWSGR